MGEGDRAPRILLVEDNPLEARAIERALRAYGHVVHAESGAAALEVIDGGDLTAAVVDWKLPDTDGLAVVRLLRERLPHVPVLMMTAHMDRDCINSAHLLGAEYVTKPATLENLQAFAQRVLAPAPAHDPEELARRWAEAHQLSTSEAEILRLAMCGAPRAEIPGLMSLSANTVKTYVKRLLDKTDAPSLGELVRRILHEALKS